MVSEDAANMQRRLGILAYGSLINDPGPELAPRIVDRINVQTPFAVEFARTSKSRGNAPTLVRVEEKGASVSATILVLGDDTTIDEATDMLYRRERHDFSTTVRYSPRDNPGPNVIVIDRLKGLGGVETVLYTRIGATIPNPTAAALAQLAIDSVSKPRTAEDGISYLIGTKASGIVTPLSGDYEREILKRTDADSLEDALAILKRTSEFEAG